MDPLHLSDHVVQNRQTGEQMTHWDILNKATKFEFSFFNMFQCVICSPVWQFCTKGPLGCKGPILSSYFNGAPCRSVGAYSHTANIMGRRQNTARGLRHCLFSLSLSLPIGHLHDGVILLLRPEFTAFFLS